MGIADRARSPSAAAAPGLPSPPDNPQSRKDRRYERSHREPQAGGHLDRRSAALDSVGAADSAASGHGPLSEFVHAARGRARELRAPHRRRDRERQAHRRLHAARCRRRGAGAGRSVPGRHRDAHPQDVQAARRQPSSHRAGARAAAPRVDRRDAAVPARAGERGRRGHQRR